jgi:predicted acetyltransferase
MSMQHRRAVRETGRVTNVDVRDATIDEKPVLRQLLELYCHDFSELNGADVDERGVYRYPYLDNYWTEPERHPFLIRVDGRLAGLAFVRAGSPHDMAEFFIMRKYRRGGIGVEAARAVFARFPGEWQVRELAANVGAVAFWRRAILVPFTEDTNHEGPVQHFVMPASPHRAQ